MHKNHGTVVFILNKFRLVSVNISIIKYKLY